MTHVKKEDFELLKVKFNANGLEVNFKANKHDEQGHKSELLFNVTSPVICHPELLIFKTKLREYLMRSVGLYKLHDIAMKYLKGDQKDKVAEAFGDMVYETEVMSVSKSGQDQLEGIIISGKMTNLMEGKTAINSPRMVFSSDKMGFEDDVETLYFELEEEVYAYIFENKKAQLDLFEEQKVEAV